MNPIDHILNILPDHKCSLTITHNEHLDIYQTAGQVIHEQDLVFESDEQKKRAMATNELWIMQWYPETPIGFNRVAAPTLSELVKFAHTIT